jgi:hypothetical protein
MKKQLLGLLGGSSPQETTIKSPEHPDKITYFREQISALQWGKEVRATSLSKLFDAVEDLAEAEVRYYFQRRGRTSWWSGKLRFLAWGCGSIGAILPLLAATNQATFSALGPWGFVFLAAAASFLGANALFGGTTGHVRFVTNQLALERLIASKRIEWSSYSASVDDDPTSEEALEKGFKYIQVYVEEIYLVVTTETGAWSKAVLEQIGNLEKTLSTAKTPSINRKQ